MSDLVVQVIVLHSDSWRDCAYRGYFLERRAQQRHNPQPVHLGQY